VKATGVAVHGVLSVLGLGVTRFGIKQKIGIEHPSMRVSIGMGCSGLEGIFFFLCAYLLFLFFLKERPTWKRVSLTIVGGIAFMFVLNVFRIVLFFAVALAINAVSVEPEGRAFFKWAFHQNIGWVLYFIGIALFLRYFSVGPAKRPS